MCTSLVLSCTGVTPEKVKVRCPSLLVFAFMVPAVLFVSVDPARWAVALTAVLLKALLLCATAFATFVTFAAVRQRCGLDANTRRKAGTSDEEHETAVAKDALVGIGATVGLMLVDRSRQMGSRGRRDR